jgi:hypothetical protein
VLLTAYIDLFNLNVKLFTLISKAAELRVWDSATPSHGQALSGSEFRGQPAGTEIVPNQNFAEQYMFRGIVDRIFKFVPTLKL